MVSLCFLSGWGQDLNATIPYFYLLTVYCIQNAKVDLVIMFVSEGKC